MKVPEIFFGTLKEVQSNCRKLVTQLRKGKHLSQLLSTIKFVESDDYPESLFWIDRMWSQRGKEKHFVLCQLGLSIFIDDRLDMKHKLAVTSANAEYLSSSPWGTLILNGGTCYLWAEKYSETKQREFSKIGLKSILSGYVNFYDIFIEQGKRYYIGGWEKKTFEDTQFLASYAFANLGKKYLDLLPKGISLETNRIIKETVIKENLLEQIEAGTLPQ